VIVDGQQRLTSAYAVIKAMPVVTKDFETTRIRIAFQPKTEEFEVANTATDKDPEWLSDVSTIWNHDGGAFAFTLKFIEELKKYRDLDSDGEKRIAENLGRLENIKSYLFTAIQLSHEMEVEEVSNIFVRVNSKGTRLSQADFILTLRSVYWEDGRKALEQFCREAKLPAQIDASPFNYFIQPSPDQLLRVAVGLGLRRGRLSATYQVLRGKDPDTGQFSDEAREKQFGLLRSAQEDVTDLTNWHEFLKSLRQAGYRSSSMVTSDNNILYSYLAYLIGRRDHDLTHLKLRELISKWFFMSALTGRYTGTPETQVEADIRRLADASTGEEFEDVIETAIGTNLTTDFWNVTLPDLLSTSSGYSPYLFAYYASLNLLNARALFSNLPVSELMDPALKAKKQALERHHMFPRAYLEEIGITTVARVNQIANYALLEWPQNSQIGASPPAEYFGQFFEEWVDPADAEKVRFWHALPEGWEQMDYNKFLEKRRRLIAKVIKAGFDKLVTGAGPFVGKEPAVAVLPSVRDLINAQEGGNVEFKSSARYSVKPDIPEKVIHDGIVKTVAAFMNSEGGSLLIGVADDARVLGIDRDLQVKSHNEDQHSVWLMTLLKERLGVVNAALTTTIRFETEADKRICILDIQPSPRPVYAKTSKSDAVFFVRLGASTRQLPLEEVHDYIQSRWEQAAPAQ